MRRGLLAYVCCPTCGGTLDLRVSSQRDENIEAGTLCCVRCASTYLIRNGIPHLVPEGGRTVSNKAEIDGWVSLWKKKGMYDNPDRVSSFKLPYLDGGPWPPIARMFDMAREEMGLNGNETILDIGAGQGWSARYFAEKGCTAIAMDIVADELYGLGRAWAIMDHANVYFEPVLADGETLPFFPERFGIVYYSAALHHFKKFRPTLEQAFRVLKPGGKLIASSEPVISLFSREQLAQDVLEETREGITERRPKLPEYWWILRRAGFHSIKIDTFETFRASPLQVYSWIMLVRQNLSKVVRFKPLKPLVWLALTLIAMLPHRWAVWLTLLVNGGTVLITATKPAR